MFDLFLFRVRGSEAMCGISPFETGKIQSLIRLPELNFYDGYQKNQIPPFQSEALKEKAQPLKARPQTSNCRFEIAAALVALSFIVLELACFFLVARLID